MKLAPGSTLWLLRHELRLQWRNTSNKVVASFGLLGALALMHLIAIPLSFLLPATKHLPDSVVLALVTSLLWLIGLGMCSRALIMLVQFLYERGDGDLLLTSPIPPRSVISARAWAIVVGLLYEFGGFLWPLVNVFAIMGHVRWLLAYAVLPCLALLATAVSLWLALGLFAWIGARRTRVLAQVVSALLGSSGLLLSQLPQLWAGEERSTLIVELLLHLPEDDDAFWLPARAALGSSAWAAGVAVALAITSFGLSVGTSGPRITRVLLDARGLGTRGKKRVPRSTLPKFRTGVWRALITKELRLLARDAWLITQLFQQNLYLLPLFFGLWQSVARGVPFAWAGMVMASSTVAGALAWLAAAAEDAPELLLSAPLAPSTLKRAKLAAALLPVLATVWIPVLWLSFAGRPWSALAIGVCSVGSGLCSALLHLRVGQHAKPGHTRKQRNLRDRYRGHVLLGLWDFLLMGVWVTIALLVIFWEHARGAS